MNCHRTLAIKTHVFVLIYLARFQESPKKTFFPVFPGLISKHISKRNNIKAKEHLGKGEEYQSKGGGSGKVSWMFKMYKILIWLLEEALKNLLFFYSPSLHHKFLVTATYSFHVDAMHPRQDFHTVL